MDTINLQYNSLSQIRTLWSVHHAENSVTGTAYVHGRSADTNLAVIQDKQVNVQNKSLF